MSLIPTVYGTGRRINFFNRFSSDLRNPSYVIPVATPSIDWKETPEAHVFKVELPGLKKGDVKLEILWGRVLQISGDSNNKEKKEKNGIMSTWHRMERSGGRFLRRFNLPENSKVDQLKAFMENGVLTITVPKEESKKPYLKHVQITG